MINKIKYLLVSSRPISWINTAYPFAAGYLLTIREVDAIFIIGSLFFLIPYNLLMYGINDVFDYESDMQNPRKGGIEGALLAKSQHRTVIIAATVLSLPFTIYLLALSTRPWGVIALLGVIFLVLAYSVPKLRFKERPFIDSMTSSAHFVGPLLYALTFSDFTSSYAYMMAAFFLWGMASHAFGAVQDIVADKKGKIASVATIIGAKQTVRLSIVLYSISAIVLLHFGWIGLIIAVTEMLYVVSIWPYRSISEADAEQANSGWKRFIALNWFSGFVITMVLIYVFIN